MPEVTSEDIGIRYKRIRDKSPRMKRELNLDMDKSPRLEEDFSLGKDKTLREFILILLGVQD